VTLVVRGSEVIMPRGRTVLQSGDQVFVAMRRKVKPLMDCLFDTCAEPVILTPGQKIVFRADHTIEQLCGFFTLGCPPQAGRSLEALVHSAENGATVRLGPFLVAPGDDSELVTLIFSPEQKTSAPNCGCIPPENMADTR